MKFIKTLMLVSLFGLTLTANAQIYGRLKANWMQADNALNSFSNPNMSAPTTATNLKDFTETDGERSTFQVVQSRIGGKYHANDKVTALVEMDFIDFGQASPTTSAHPRLRRAFIAHQLTEKFSLQIGQDWDLFSGLNPSTFNYIGNYFHSGNVGFMRNQIIGKYNSGSNQYAFAIGQAGKSSAAADSELETKKRDSLSASFQKTLDKSVISLSAIYANRDFNSETQKIWGANLGLKYSNSYLILNSEFYTGEGLSKMALLSLPSTTFGHESGAYLTAEYLVSDAQSIYLGAGVAYAQNPDTSVFDTTKLVYTNLGAKKNTTVKLGFSQKLDGVKYYGELTRYYTEYTNEFQANSLELGTLLYF